MANDVGREAARPLCGLGSRLLASSRYETLDARVSRTTTGHDREANADFPSLNGTLVPIPDWHTAWPPEIQRYREYCVLASSLVETGSAYEELVARHEAEHITLIESKDWLLRDEAGHLETILIPIFHEDGSISWRWRIEPTCSG